MGLTVHLDTNAYSAYLRGLPDAVFIIDHAPLLGLSPIVIGELKAGFALGSQETRNLEQLRRARESPRLRMIRLDDSVTDRYARIVKQLRREGTPIPTNDLWIAACVPLVNAALFTLDDHFRQVDGLQVVSTRGEMEAALKSSADRNDT